MPTTTAQRKPPADFAQILPDLLKHDAPKLYALALRMCGNDADAQDMLQDTFLQAHRKWHTFRGDANPSTWLYAIAARMCKKRLKRKYASTSAMPAFSQVAPWTESSVSAAGLRLDTPFKKLEEKEATQAVHSAILTIPEHFRVPLILKEMLELSIEDVAQALDLKPETVKTRVHRARLLLRKALMDELPQKPAPDPMYEKQVCIDLLKAKLEAMDKGRGFPIGQNVICARCQAVFRELDLVQDTCARLAEGSLPAELRRSILAAINSSPPHPRRPAHQAAPPRAANAESRSIRPRSARR